MRIIYKSNSISDEEALEYLEDRNDRVLDINSLIEIPKVLSSMGYRQYKVRTMFTFMPDSFRPLHIGDLDIPAVRIEYEIGGRKYFSRNSASNFSSEEDLKSLIENSEPTEFTAWLWDFCPDNNEPSIIMIRLLCADE